MGEEDVKLSCVICMEEYSEYRFPIVSPHCGHSICRDCGHRRNSPVCVTCNVENFRSDSYGTPWRSDTWYKNFSLLEIINMCDAEQKKVNAAKCIDYLECSSCKKMEERGRMKICFTCADGFDKEWEKRAEEEISSFILCSCCVLEKHNGHRYTKYLLWKLNGFLTPTVSNGVSSVFSMDEICAHEIEKGKEQLEKWSEEMNSFYSVDCKTYRNALAIESHLQREADIVTNVSEKCVGPLRVFRQAVTAPSEVALIRIENDERIRELNERIEELNETISQLTQNKGNGEQAEAVGDTTEPSFLPGYLTSDNGLDVDAVRRWNSQRQRVEMFTPPPSTFGSGFYDNNVSRDCYKCGHDDHASRECPGPDGKVFGSPRFRLLCSKCGRVGHTGSTCTMEDDREEEF